MAAIGMHIAGAATALLLLATPTTTPAADGGDGLIRLDFALRAGEPTPASRPGRCPQVSDADDVVVCGRRAHGLSQRVAPRARQAGDRVLGEPLPASDVLDFGSTDCSTVGPLQDCDHVNILAIAVRAAELIYRKVAQVPDEQPDWTRLTAEMLPVDDR